MKAFITCFLSIIIGTVISICSLVFLPCASAQSPTRSTIGFMKKLPIGMNLSSINYYTPGPLFTDVMKTASDMFSFTVGGGDWDSGKIDQIPRDTNGYPTQIPYSIGGVSQGIRFLISSFYEGEYVILYDGEGDLKVYGVPSSDIDGTIHFTMPGIKTNVWINITSSTLGNHIRNIRIIPVEYLNNPSTMPIFRQDYIDGLSNFACIRYNGILRGSQSDVEFWADRSTDNYYSQGTSKGVSLEHVIELSNIISVDAWITVPYKATDKYITQMATMIKSNLDPNLKVYIEYSNELWNWIFPSAHYVADGAPSAFDTYVSADLTAIESSGGNFPEQSAYMAARTFRLFADVFGSEMSTRVVRVVASQHAWPDNTRRILKYLFETDGKGADAMAVGGYFYWNPADHNIWVSMRPEDVTPEMVLQSADKYYADHTGSWITQTAAYTKQYGVDYIVYEGGQHMQPHQQKNWDYNHAVWDAQIAQGIYDLYAKNFAAHAAVDCKLFMAYAYVGERKNRYGSWGHLESLDQINKNSISNLLITAPKAQSLIDFNFK